MLEVNWKMPKIGGYIKKKHPGFARQLEDGWFQGLPKDKPRILYASVTLTHVNHGPYNTHISSAYFAGCECKKYRMVPLLIYRHEIARARNRAALTAIKGGFSHLAFVDDDTHLEEKTIGQLVERMGEFNACSAGYYIRGWPFHPMVFRWMDEAKTKMKLPDPWDYEKYIDEDGVMRRNVAGLGCGVTMFRVNDFKRVPFPWFISGQNFTEDAYWFTKAHKNLKRYKVGMDFNIDAGHQCEPLVVRHSNVKVLREAYGKLYGKPNEKKGG